MRNIFGAAIVALLTGSITAFGQSPDAGTPPTASAGDRVPAPALSLARIADGDRLMQERRYREAAFAYLDAVHAEAANVEASFKLANAYAVLGYFDQAIAYWNRAADQSDDPAVRRSADDNISKARVKADQAGGGTPQLQGKAPGSGPISDAAKEKARASYEQGVKQISSKDYTGAVGSLATAITHEPTLTVAYIARGSALIGLKRYGEAVLDYQHALKLSPAMASPIYGLAEAYRALGRIPEAREFYQRYLESTASDIRPNLQDDARKKLEKL